MSDATDDTPAPTADPTPPYTVEHLVYGTVSRPTRKYPGGAYGDILSPDEVAMWEYAEALGQRLAALRTELALAGFDSAAAAAELTAEEKAGFEREILFAPQSPPAPQPKAPDQAPPRRDGRKR